MRISAALVSYTDVGNLEVNPAPPRMEAYHVTWHIRRMATPDRQLAVTTRGEPSPLEALGRWVRENLRWLKGQLRRRDRSEQDVDDLIQEAILRVAESCERYEVRDSASFLVRTVTRLSMNDCRDRQRHPYDPRPVEELDGITPLIDASPLPEEIANQQQQWKLIEEVLDTVDERTRKAFILNRIHGLKYAEVAQQLGVSASTVEKDITWVMALLIDAARD